MSISTVWLTKSNGPCIAPGLYSLRSGTCVIERRFNSMSENLPHLMESAVQIAWDYLEQTGQIDDGAFTSRFLMNTIEDMDSKKRTAALVIVESRNHGIRAVQGGKN